MEQNSGCAVGLRAQQGGGQGVLCECVCICVCERMRARRGASFDSAGVAEVEWVAL